MNYSIPFNTFKTFFNSVSANAEQRKKGWKEISTKIKNIVHLTKVRDVSKIGKLFLKKNFPKLSEKSQ